MALNIQQQKQYKEYVLRQKQKEYKLLIQQFMTWRDRAANILQVPVSFSVLYEPIRDEEGRIRTNVSAAFIATEEKLILNSGITQSRESLENDMFHETYHAAVYLLDKEKYLRTHQKQGAGKFLYCFHDTLLNIYELSAHLFVLHRKKVQTLLDYQLDERYLTGLEYLIEDPAQAVQLLVRHPNWGLHLVNKDRLRDVLGRTDSSFSITQLEPLTEILSSVLEELLSKLQGMSELKNIADMLLSEHNPRLKTV